MLNNVETFANIAPIILKGAEWYASTGTEKSKGTKVFALGGAIQHAGLVEVPIGVQLGEIVYEIGGGVPGGKELKAVQLGGPSGGCIPKADLNVPVDYETLQELGAIMGSGGCIVMDDDSCMVDVARFFLDFIQDESCGKCPPCRVGTKRMLEIVTRICNGEGKEGDIEALEDLGNIIKDTALCGLGQTAANPVLSTIRHFRHEYEAHIKDHYCEAGVCSTMFTARCTNACPASVNVPGFVSLIGEKRFDEALKLHRERNPLASICGRVCFHPCESKCQRGGLDEPVAIRSLKRFMTEQETEVQLPEVRENAENAATKVAVIGSGPAGLSCAYFLARLGYKPTIFEKEPSPGGMLVQAIPAYRLPREELGREISMIESMGVDDRDRQGSGQRLHPRRASRTRATRRCSSAWAPRTASAWASPAKTAEGVTEGLTFLREYNVHGTAEVGKEVAVIGGGNSAIDAARTALRLGAKHVNILYRRQREQMPAWAEEILAADEEGITVLPLTAPKEILRDAAGKVTGVLCQQMALGDYDKSGRRRPVAGRNPDFTVECDQVIAAIGQSLDAKALVGDLPVELQNGWFKTDRSHRRHQRRLGLRRRRRGHRPGLGGGGRGRRRAGRRGHRPVPHRRQPRLLAPGHRRGRVLRSRRRPGRHTAGGGRVPRPGGPGLHLRRGGAVLEPRHRLRRSQALPALRLRQDPGGCAAVPTTITRRGEVMPVLTVDDIKVEVPEGTTLLDACRQAGANIPTLCYLEGVQAIGACRLCLVEVEGAKTLVASCAQPADRRHGGEDQLHPGPRAGAAPSSSCSSPSTTATARPASAAATASCAAWPSDLGIDEITYEGEKTAQADRHVHPRPGARHRQVRLVPALRHRLQRDPGRGRPVPAGPRLRHRHRPGVRQQPERRGLRPVRPVRRRLPGGRHHREQRRRSGLGRARRPDEARHRADRARHPRRPRRGVRLRARHPGHRQDGLRPPPARLRRRVRHQLHRRPHHHGRGHRAAHPAQEGPGRRRAGGPADVHQLLPGLDQLHGALQPRHARQPVHLQVAAADVRRPGQDLLRRRSSA